MSRYKAWWIGLVCLSLSLASRAQIVRIDSVAVAKPQVQEDTSAYSTKHHRDPRKATIRSAIIPGWGQVYNHKYWKVPLVYGGLVACGLIFNYNLQQYKLYRRVYKEMVGTDTTWHQGADSIYLYYSPQDVQFARNSARQYVDYSALAFLLMWGLNVIDATVDAHLHEFDVTDKLTLSIQPKSGLTNGFTGLSLVLDIHPPKRRLSPILTKHIF